MNVIKFDKEYSQHLLLQIRRHSPPWSERKKKTIKIKHWKKVKRSILGKVQYQQIRSSAGKIGMSFWGQRSLIILSIHLGLVILLSQRSKANRIEQHHNAHVKMHPPEISWRPSSLTSPPQWRFATLLTNYELRHKAYIAFRFRQHGRWKK